MTSRYFAAFCLRMTSSSDQPARIGFTLPRAVGKAVVRNRIRRRMREAAGTQLTRLNKNWTIVFNPRRAVLGAPFEDLCRETARIVDRCNERF
jgi:ribonuclease P protein component